MQLIISLIAAAVFASNVIAHPGHDIRAEMAERAAFMQTSKRDLSHCAAKMKARGMDKRSVARRAAIAKEARKKRSIATNTPFLKARDVDTVLNTTHLSPESYTNATNEAILFASNNSCVLSPEVTQGPYYVSGEYVRENIIEDQEGVELILDTQVIDMATCDPVPDTMIEIWHCNSTGVYSGIVASGNGDSSDASNINATFLRGLQPTDSEGVAQFATLFPGHYTGRAPHIHVLAHFNGTTYANGTYGGGYVSHVGQLFFDQDLITQVEATSVYSTNTQELTTNADDSIFSQEAASSDPVVEYSLLGDDVSSGVFGWVAFGVDLTNEFTVTPAASLYAGGGEENASSGGGGPGGNSTGSGAVPSGAPPS
ncbi:extracellular dioxygenase [Stipitochalara longipes BDJ]|nr:extracellular dioxygenase [Stipitochalara longipes BDJ]